MARKPFISTIGSEVRGAVSKTITPVRNSAIPKTPVVLAKKEITREMVAERAYFISISGKGGSELDNWVRAEKELRSA